MVDYTCSEASVVTGLQTAWEIQERKYVPTYCTEDSLLNKSTRIVLGYEGCVVYLVVQRTLIEKFLSFLFCMDETPFQPMQSLFARNLDNQKPCSYSRGTHSLHVLI